MRTPHSERHKFGAQRRNPPLFGRETQHPAYTHTHYTVIASHNITSQELPSLPQPLHCTHTHKCGLQGRRGVEFNSWHTSSNPAVYEPQLRTFKHTTHTHTSHTRTHTGIYAHNSHNIYIYNREREKKRERKRFRQGEMRTSEGFKRESD